MHVERYRQIDELFAAALERPPAERPSFLDAACATDAELRAEVASLLAAYSGAGEFIEAPAMEVAARGLADEEALRTEEPAGTVVGGKVGPYSVVSLLGVGGMGEVYLARDARLGRSVALKLLPARFTRDAARVARFEREARAASSLSHPNIVTIYEIGRADGAHYIATEFVEGETLRRRMARGRLDLKEAVELVSQIAGALAAAHAEGVVHRDIKPENVMVRPDGYVKVLDFGLAKLVGLRMAEVETPSQPSPDNPPSAIPNAQSTLTGAVMGTVAYMSPEQALGHSVDPRADIFSLGVLLYELATGAHPFRGATTAATFDAILNREPPAEALAELPPELARIVGRALEKDRELRYQTASDLRAELKRLQRESASNPSAPSAAGSLAAASRHALTAPAPVASKFTRRRVLAGLCLLTLVAAGGGLLAWRRSQPHPNSASAPRKLTFTQLTYRPGMERYPSLAPDGKDFAYTTWSDGNWDIHTQRVGGRNTRNLTADSPDDDTQPAFSPDGEHVAFRSERQGGGLFIMGATGESVRRLTDFGYHPSWSPDGSQLAFSTHFSHDPNNRSASPSALWVVNVSTGAQRQLTFENRGDATQPFWSPTGARVVYWGRHRGGRRDLWTVPAAGGEPTPLTDDDAFDWNPVWAPDGRHVYFSSDRGGQMNLWRIPVDEQTGRAVGPPEPLTAPALYAEGVSFSRDGRRALYVNRVSSTNIMKATFDPVRGKPLGEVTAVTRGSRHAASPALSPDGEWFAYSSQYERQEDIFVVDKDGTQMPRQLTDDAHNDRNPRWSPDGRQLVFYSDRSGRYEVWAINRDGSGLRQLTETDAAGVAYPFFSPDGTRIAYNRNNESCTIIDANRPWAEQTPQRLPLPPEGLGAFWAFSWSPDGRKLAGWSVFGQMKPGPGGVLVYNLESGTFERVADPGENPVWLSDNRRLLVRRGGTLHLLDTVSKGTRALLSVAPNRFSGFGISADDRTLYYGLYATEADVWLIDIEEPSGPPAKDD